MDTKAIKVEEEMIPYERIPGLPYTHEERMESLRVAEENIAAGKTTDWEDLKKEIIYIVDIWDCRQNPERLTP